jgi:sporulation protein YlmC with PRC-barrel domain
MLEEIMEIVGLQAYTPKGIYLGNVDNVVMDFDTNKISGLFIRESNPMLVEGSVPVNIPYRWIQAIGDVVLLKYFPSRVTLGSGGPPPE